jgi:hypothetical protein
MPVTGVVDDQVADETQSAAVHRRDQAIQRLVTAESRIDPQVVGDVVAVIAHR